MKKQTRQAFNFYRSYYDILEDITRDEDKLTYLLALLDRQFKGVEPTLENIPRLVYNSQKHSIDKQVEGWENKTKVKLTPTKGPKVHPSVGGTEGGTEGPYLQEQEKGKEKEEVKEELVIGEGKTQEQKRVENFHPSKFIKDLVKTLQQDETV